MGAGAAEPLRSDVDPKLFLEKKLIGLQSRIPRVPLRLKRRAASGRLEVSPGTGGEVVREYADTYPSTNPGKLSFIRSFRTGGKAHTRKGGGWRTRPLEAMGSKVPSLRMEEPSYTISIWTDAYLI